MLIHNWIWNAFLKSQTELVYQITGIEYNVGLRSASIKASQALWYIFHKKNKAFQRF